MEPMISKRNNEEVLEEVETEAATHHQMMGIQPLQEMIKDG